MPAATSPIADYRARQADTQHEGSTPRTAPAAAPVPRQHLEECASLLSSYLRTAIAGDDAGLEPEPEPKHEQLRCEIVQREARIQELISDLQSEQSELTQAKTSLDEKQRELEQRRRMYDEIQKRFATQAADLAAAQERTDDLWLALSELKKESQQLRQVVSAQQEDLRGREHAVLGFEETTRILRGTNTDLEHELTCMRAQLEEARRELVGKRDRLRAVEAENSLLHKCVGASVAEPDSSMRLEQLAEELTEARVGLRMAQIERDDLLQRYENERAAVREAQERVARLEVATP